VDRRHLLGYHPATNGAQVAQLVEHATENRSVAGSIPALGTILSPSPRVSYAKGSSHTAAFEPSEVGSRVNAPVPATRGHGNPPRAHATHTSSHGGSATRTHLRIAHARTEKRWGRRERQWQGKAVVGAAGFEPTTPSPPDWCATRLRYAPTPPPLSPAAGMSKRGRLADGQCVRRMRRMADRPIRPKAGETPLGEDLAPLDAAGEGLPGHQASPENSSGLADMAQPVERQ
jgi:hypothetical protein